MPDFERIHGDSKAQDVVVLALDVDEPRETVAAYVEKEKLTFPVLLTKGADVVSYGVNAYPTTFAIDKNGLVAAILVGGGDARLQAAISTARAGASPPADKITPAVSSGGANGQSPAPTSTTTTTATTPATADDLYRDAVRERGKKNYAGAIESLRRALELRPDWLQAVLAQAADYANAKDYNGAVAAYTRAIELDPKRAFQL
jgi:hypothetical protein